MIAALLGPTAPALLAQAYNWSNVVIMGGGFVTGVDYSPVSQGLLYARTDVGGFYRWDNTNNRWIPLTDMYGPSQGNNFGGESIAPDPVNPNVVYAAAGMSPSSPGSILSSIDQGNTWTANAIPVSMGGNNDGREAGERLAVDPNLTSKLYFGSRWQGLWVSANSASSWSQVTAFPASGDSGYGIGWVVFDPHGASGSASATVYVGVLAMSSGNSNVYRSTNGGTSWTLVPGGPSNMVTPHASLGTDGNLWVVYDNGGYGPGSVTFGQIWKLNTGTLAWTNVTPSIGPGSGSGGYGGVCVDHQNANHAVVTTLDWWGGNDQVFATTNGGANWTVIAHSNTGWDAAPFANYNVNGAQYTYGCGTNAGNSGWYGDIKIDPFNSANALYETGGGVWTSSNITAATQPAGVTWTFNDDNLEETVCLYLNASASGGVLFSCLGDVAGMRHTNLTQSPASGGYCNPSFTNTNMLDFAEKNTNDVVRVGNSGTPTSDIAYSTNNGQTWTPWGSAPPGYGTANQMGSVAVAADGSRVVVSPYSGYGSPAYASSLGGAWTSCSGLPSGACVISDRSNASTFYATYPAQWVYGGTVTVYMSANGGASFSQVNTIPVNYNANGSGQFVMARSVFGMPGEFWVSTDNNLYRFTNGGAAVTNFANITAPFGVGFGKAATGQTHPAVYLSGTVNGTYGIYRCDDGVGTTWTRINDDNHQYSGAGWVEGDESIYGRCYIGCGARGILYGDTSAVTPTPTPTRTLTATPTRTPTVTSSPTPTLTPTLTITRTPTLTATLTLTVTPTLTKTGTVSPTTTPTTTLTPTVTLSPTITPQNTLTPTWTPTRTLTGTMTPTPSFTLTGTMTATLSVTGTPTQTLTPVPGATDTWTPTPTGTASVTRTPSPTPAATTTATPTWSRTTTGTPSPTPTFSPTATLTQTPPPGATNTSTPAPTRTATSTMTPLPTKTATPTATWTLTVSWTPTPTSTPTPTPLPTDTPVPLPTAALSLFAAPGTVSPGDLLTYTVQLTVSNAPYSGAPLVLTLPPEVAFSGYTTGPNGSLSGNQVSWNLGTVAPGTYNFGVETTVSGAASGVLTGQAALGGLSSNTAGVTVAPFTATPTAEPLGHPVIYPNPVSGPGPVAIRLPNFPGTADVKVAVFTTAFRRVNHFTAHEQAGGSDLVLPLSQEGGAPLANGLYYVRVTTPAGTSIEKLLILR